jgi:GAF domain-containing protein
MPRPRTRKVPLTLGQSFLAPGSPFQRYRWAVLVAAVVLEVLIVALVHWGDSTLHPLDPVGGGVVFISVLAAGLSGTLVGLTAVLAAVVASFLLLADFSTGTAAANAVASALIWCVAVLVTGLVVGSLRAQVARREAGLKQALEHSIAARRTMEHILDFSADFHKAETLGEAARTICEKAVATVGADSARLFALRGQNLELLAREPAEMPAVTGCLRPMADFPDLEELLRATRPSFVRDVRRLRLEEAARDFQMGQGTVSALRLPILDPTGLVGVLVLGWTHAIERPTPELLAIMRRFADQAAIAWEHALQAEAQARADALHQTMQRVVTFASTFHIRGSREEVAQAICEAALATFDCSAAALYRVESDRLLLLARVPPDETAQAGLILPLGPEMWGARELRSRAPLFLPDVQAPHLTHPPWLIEVAKTTGGRSVLCAPLRFNERGPRNLLLLGWDRPQPAPDQRLLVVVQRFADQAALALTNASAERLHARLEASLLPSSPPSHPSLLLVTRYLPGEQRLRLGGDFLGATPTADGGLDFIIGDVSGHGPDAAALGATLRSAWKTLALAGQGVASLANTLCRLLLSERREANTFATVVAGSIHPDLASMSLVNAGHPPPLLVTDHVEALEVPPSPPLGPDETCTWPVHQLTLPPNGGSCFTRMG